MSERVTGIGGVFFKAKDCAKLGAWYREHLGIEVVDGEQHQAIQRAHFLRMRATFTY